MLSLLVNASVDVRTGLRNKMVDLIKSTLAESSFSNAFGEVKNASSKYSNLKIFFVFFEIFKKI